MVAICQTCGAEGFSVALIFCDKCQVTAMHRYCLDKMPATFTENVTWFCDNCAPKAVKPSTDKAIPAPLIRSVRFPKSVKVFLARNRVKRSIEARAALKRKNTSGKDHKRVQKLEKQRRLMLRDNANTDEKAESSKAYKDQNLEEAELSKTNNDQKIGEAKYSKITQNQKLEEYESSKISNVLKLEEVESNKIKENQKLEEYESSKIDNDLKLEEVESNKINENKISVDMNLEKQRRSILEDKGDADQEAESRKITTNDDRASTSEQNIGVPAQPIVDPVWRGRFSICDTKFSSMDGLAAHLSTNACLKVLEEARLLPELLFSDMVPRDDVWPTSFRSSEPREDHIALYFFPENERDERVFDSLVEYMIEEDLAMRAVAVNAELLVFTSIQLPLGYWRFQAKYYLWGVFRRKQTLFSRQEGHLKVHNNSNESVVTTVSAAVEGDLRNTLSRNRWSPISPLRNGSYG